MEEEFETPSLAWLVADIAEVLNESVETPPLTECRDVSSNSWEFDEAAKEVGDSKRYHFSTGWLLSIEPTVILINP